MQIVSSSIFVGGGSIDSSIGSHPQGESGKGEENEEEEEEEEEGQKDAERIGGLWRRVNVGKTARESARDVR